MSLSGLQSAAASAAGTTTASAAFEGSKWGSKLVTVGFANSATGTEFSGGLTGQEKTILNQALKAWSTASGLTFQIVSSPQTADIQIGLGDFNTSSTGVLGFTSYQSKNGQLQPGVVVRMEDSSQTPFIGGSDGNLIYSDSNASFYQVALHEIGHALGLGDNADPNSIMYYAASALNQHLNATDLNNIAALYGNGAGATDFTAQPSSTGAAALPAYMAAVTHAIPALGPVRALATL
jgi:hypothetical protein